MGTITDVQGNINAQKYIQIVNDNLWPVIARHLPENDYIFMDDNAPVHRVNIRKALMTNNNINVKTWPAQSLDLNVIKNIWLRLQQEPLLVSSTPAKS